MTDTTSGGFALEHEHLTVPPVHIPDGNGGAYKTELVLERDPTVRTRKIIWWHADDPRPDPHNHPWPFVSTILAGGYTEHRWWFGPDGRIMHGKCIWSAGHRNFVDPLVFHRVVDVQPGTVTSLDCGPASAGNQWYYLDLSTGELVSSEVDPTFRDQLAEINPHLRAQTSREASDTNLTRENT